MKLQLPPSTIGRTAFKSYDNRFNLSKEEKEMLEMVFIPALTQYPDGMLERLIILFSPHALPYHLSEGSRSIDWLERYAVAQNINTPPDILSNLTKDVNRLVRQTAINKQKKDY